MILMIILIKGALDRRVLESHQDLPLLHDQDRWICWGWGKYEKLSWKEIEQYYRGRDFLCTNLFSDLGLPTQPEAPNPYNQGTWEMILTKSLRLGEPDFFLLHCLKGHSYEYKDFLLGCRPSSQLHESWRDRNSDMRWCCRRVAFIILEVSVLILVLVFFFSPGRRLWSSWTTAWPVAANSIGPTPMICSTGNVVKHLIILPILAWFLKSFDLLITESEQL